MAKAPTKTPAKQESGTVRMVRSADYPAPHEAEVHPSEVENYRSGGWQEQGK